MKIKHAELRATLRKKQQNRCCYCRVRMVLTFHTTRMPPNAETLEHLDRRADGGSNRRGNLALACYDCNSGRGSVDWLTYTTIKRDELFDLIAGNF